ncbi:MAG: regulatory protein RecX [Acidobacteria bacterium]|nr:regulatory protein RecX [Acidobacteriota bacterium]
MPRDVTPPDPYAYGLAALGRRELTERQLRTRLARRGCEPGAVDAALTRLRREGLLDDVRAARAFARTEARIKHRGPIRIRRTLETMGLDREQARQATDEGFEERPVSEALEYALARRLRGPVTDGRHARRLVGYLVRQGFELSDAVAAVRRASGGSNLEP